MITGLANVMCLFWFDQNPKKISNDLDKNKSNIVNSKSNNENENCLPLITDKNKLFENDRSQISIFKIY